jgi:hypothetical protein
VSKQPHVFGIEAGFDEELVEREGHATCSVDDECPRTRLSLASAAAVKSIVTHRL